MLQVITCADFHPQHCNLFAYSSSKGLIRLADMRAAALCDQHAKLFEDAEPSVGAGWRGGANVWLISMAGAAPCPPRQPPMHAACLHRPWLAPAPLRTAPSSPSQRPSRPACLPAFPPAFFLSSWCRPQQGPRSFFSEIISSINDIKFSPCGRYLLSRDYMTLKLWDIHQEAAPLAAYPVHESLRGKVRRGRQRRR